MYTCTKEEEKKKARAVATTSVGKACGARTAAKIVWPATLCLKGA